MKKVTVLAIAAVLGLVASSSNAALTLSGHLPQNAVLVGGNTFVWTLTVATDAPGGLVGGFSGAINPATTLAFEGPMSQVKVAGIIDTPTAQNNANIDEAADSQFKFVDNQLIAAVPPFETATTLGGGFSIGNAARAASLALVQIAVPNTPGNTVHYSFEVGEALPGDVVNLQTFTGDLVVPEPSTVALGAFGVLGMLGAALRRRMA